MDISTREKDNQLFCFNNKIDEIIFDCVIINGVMQRKSYFAKKHRLNVRDLSLPLNHCIDLRDSDSQIDDLIVNDPSNSGLLINWTGHWIQQIKYSIVGWTHEEEHHEQFAALQLLSCLGENSMIRPSFFIIPFTGCLSSRVWPDGTIDLSKLDATELVIKLHDTTIPDFSDSPFMLFSDTKIMGSVIEYFSINVRVPIIFKQNLIDYLTCCSDAKTAIDTMILTGNKFSIARYDPLLPCGSSIIPPCNEKAIQPKIDGVYSDQYGNLYKRNAIETGGSENRVPYSDMVNNTPCAKFSVNSDRCKPQYSLHPPQHTSSYSGSQPDPSSYVRPLKNHLRRVD